LAEHEHGRFKDDVDQVEKWRLALQHAADFASWPFETWVINFSLLLSTQFIVSRFVDFIQYV
jgi:hypothetical protein